MTTRVHIRAPYANHLGVRVLQANPSTPGEDSKVVAELRHGERFEGYVHLGSELTVCEMPLLAPEPRELSRAEKLAGVSFNPSGNPLVSESKAGYAERIAEVEALLRTPVDSDQANMLVDARSHLIAAQMLVTKAITWSK
jgi:hypothetical protein